MNYLKKKHRSWTRFGREIGKEDGNSLCIRTWGKSLLTKNVSGRSSVNRVVKCRCDLHVTRRNSNLKWTNNRCITLNLFSHLNTNPVSNCLALLKSHQNTIHKKPNENYKTSIIQNRFIHITEQSKCFGNCMSPINGYFKRYVEISSPYDYCQLNNNVITKS